MLSISVNKLFHEHKREVAFFLMTGALSALAYFLSFSVFWKTFGIYYSISVSLAYLVSIIVHFNINRRVTFKSINNHAIQQIPKYMVMVGINYVITLSIVHIVVEKCHLSPYFGIVCSIAGTVGTGYLLSRYWVFNNGDGEN